MPVKKTISSKYDLLGTYTINGYEYDLRSYLKLWVDFAETPSDRSLFSSDINTIEYEGSVTSELQTIGNIQYNVARFDDSENLNALITYNSVQNPTSFGDGTSDNPFSVSFWYYRDSATAAATQEIFFEKGDDTSSKSEYRGKISSSGYIEFQLTDASTGGIETCSDYHPDCASSFDIADINDEWDHYVFTYDGSTGRNGMNVYVNGSLLSSPARSGAGSYTSLEAVSSKFFIGADKDGNAEADGYMSEFAVFSKELSANEIQSIYLGTKDKVQLTVIKSGKINNPARTIIKDLDNRTGTYPTVHRMNKKDTTGILSNVLFSDDKVIKFGTRIKDDFKIKNIDLFNVPVNSNKWTVTTGVEVRREVDPKGDNLITKSLLQLSGEGDSDGRWIRTAKKVTNPTVYLKILRGPFNDTENNLVKLSKGGSTETLKIQASTAGSSWTTIAIETPYISSTANENLITNDGLDAQYPFFGEADQNNIGIISNNKRPQLSLKIPAEAFANAGFYDPFYIRIIQENIADDTKTIWAIDSIDIISREDQVSYPQLSILGDVAHNFYLTQSIATPNYLGSLTTTGSAIEGITDPYTRTLNNNEQQLSPFNEESVIDYENSLFFNEGTNEDITPGFGSSLLSKTSFKINLSTNEKVQTGFFKEYNSPSSDDSGDGNIFMTYWNYSKNSYEKIGMPLGVSFQNVPGTSRPGGENINNVISFLTSSAVGFGPKVRTVTTGLLNDYAMVGDTLLSDDHLKTGNKPITTFNFPYGSQYFATGSQVIKAESLGITKPFLLEKSRLIFDIEAEFPAIINTPNIDYKQSYASRRKYGSPDASGANTLRGFQTFTPTFFILKQSKSSYNINKKFEIGDIPSSVNEYNYNISIPGYYQISSGSSSLTYVDKTRDLVTFGQTTFVIKYTNYSDITNTSVRDALFEKIGSDNVVFVNTGLADTHEGAFSFTGSNITTNFKTKNVSKYEKANQIIISEDSTNLTSSLYLGKESSTRGGIDLSDNRSLVNGNASFTPSKNDVLILGTLSSQQGSTIKTPDSNTIILDSPYLIMPNDELILGWQYPLPIDYYDNFPTGSLDADGARFKMSIGNSSLEIFGSQIKDGKEFHDGLNQNLTSNVIHEVIGNEPVIDQWQIATRNEMTGSFSDQFMLSLQTAPAGSTDFDTGYVIGRFVTPDPDANTAKNTQLLWKNGNNPISRINSRFSTVVGNSVSILGNNGLGIYAFINVVDNITGPKKPANSWVQQIQAFTNKADYSRIFFDSERLNGSDAILDYGSSQNYSYQSGGSNIIKLGGSPKYYFNSKHYGFYSDNIRQGLDSRFKIKKGDTFDNNVFEQTVKVQFVESEYDNEDLRFRIFKPIRSDEITGTAYEEFQSSNISLFATSSIPFFDDNVVRNRTYVDDRLTVS